MRTGHLSRLLGSVTVLALAASACTTDAGAPPPDAGGGPDGCTAAACDDGLFCNGTEACGAGGCEAGTPPCAADRCDETADACAVCDTDDDGDGVRAIACGGSDCDDSDRTRYPGNTEVCDPDDHDEDCDPHTFGFRDADSDGFADSACCNVDGADRFCGTDCDDTAPAVHPTEAETCNGVDDDCDTAIDEGVLRTFYVDADGDGYGTSDPAAPTARDCAPPEGFAERGDDCDDTPGSGDAVHPGAVEACDAAMRDEDCDGVRNEACGCPVAGETMPCCSGRGTQTCQMIAPEGSEWSACSVGSVPETCGGGDEDCDGTTDEGGSAWCNAIVTGQSCVSGMCVCPAGQAACGGACVAVGGACDGPDADDCAEGTWVCGASGTVVCNDATGDSGTTRFQCGAAQDYDCDGLFYENGACVPGTTEACRICGVSGVDWFANAGTRPCNVICGWDPCGSTAYGVTGINAPPAWSPWTITGSCGSVSGGRDYSVPYTATASGCNFLTSPAIAFRPGRYDVFVDHHDSAVLVTPSMTLQVPGIIFSRTIRNSAGGWQTHSFSFTVTGCVSSAITVRSDTNYYDGSSGGSAGYYRGGDTLGTIRVVGPY